MALTEWFLFISELIKGLSVFFLGSYDNIIGKGKKGWKHENILKKI